eukprot:jgi/Botrbrau1/13763/Bobra.0056s0019.1
MVLCRENGRSGRKQLKRLLCLQHPFRCPSCHFKLPSAEPFNFNEKRKTFVQVHKPSDAGSWDLEVSPSIQAISEYKAALIAALTDAKYDKIIHVRQAAVKALHELEYIPGSATMNGFTWCAHVRALFCSLRNETCCKIL